MGREAIATAILQETKRVVERLTGTHIFRSMPRGVDLFYDLRGRLPKLEIRTVFDVGANVGQSAAIYLREFPAATIYCFEPVAETFRQLQERLHGHTNVLPFRLAIASELGTGQMAVGKESDQAFLESSGRPVGDRLAANAYRLEEVTVETLDGFCCSHDIAHIDYLKIDTEGGDIEVLKGALSMLERQEIDVIEVEAGMNHRNTRHAPFEGFLRFLEERRYFLFGVYDQVEEWPTNERNLRRVNPVFISDRVIKAHRTR